MIGKPEIQNGSDIADDVLYVANRGLLEGMTSDGAAVRDIHRGLTVDLLSGPDLETSLNPQEFDPDYVLEQATRFRIGFDSWTCRVKDEMIFAERRGEFTQMAGQLPQLTSLDYLVMGTQQDAKKATQEFTTTDSWETDEILDAREESAKFWTTAAFITAEAAKLSN